MLLSLNDQLVDAVNAILPPNGVCVLVWGVGEPVEGSDTAVLFKGLHIASNTGEEGLIQAMLVNGAASVMNDREKQQRKLN